MAQIVFEISLSKSWSLQGTVVAVPLISTFIVWTESVVSGADPTIFKKEFLTQDKGGVVSNYMPPFNCIDCQKKRGVVLTPFNPLDLPLGILFWIKI